MTAHADMARARDFTVIAIISAHNEEDIIGQVLQALIDEGVRAYLIDDGSTDRTVAAAEPFLGSGLLSIERFSASGSGEYDWIGILRRKEELARDLDADWFIHHDADEFRESVWSGMTLRDAIRLVDRAGYNAIDFALLNFWPTHDEFRTGDDPRVSFPYYERGQTFNRLQVRCWKKTGARVDLTTEAGHNATFEGRRVFPLRFLLRHYPIRTQAQAERKIFQERRPRFRSAEREMGWHHHYDDATPETRFIRDPAGLVAYDPAMVRLGLHVSTRAVEELEAWVEALYGRVTELQAEGVQLRDEVRRGLDEMQAQRRAVDAEIQAQRRAMDAMLSARTWRWTAPIRQVGRWVRSMWRDTAAQHRETGR